MASSRGVSFWSGCQLLINNTVGPALVLLPSLFQHFGYVSVLLILCLVSVLSVLSAWMLSQTLHDYTIRKAQHRSYSRLDDEEHEHGITLFHVMQQYIASKTILKCILSIYIIALILRVMSAIIQSGQIIDYMIIDTFHKTCAFTFGASANHEQSSLLCSATIFESDSYIISLGYFCLMIICFILFRTLNFDNINDMIWLQWFANIVVVILLAIWLYIFFSVHTFETSRVHAWYKYNSNHHENLSHMISIICANYAFIIPVPSWFTQRAKSVDNRQIMKTFAYSIVFVYVLFALIGVFGGMAFTMEVYHEYDDNLFTVLNDSIFASTLSKMSVYMFPIAQNITTIPVLVVIIACNIRNFEIEYSYSLAMAAIIPCVMSVFFFTGDGFNAVCDWTSLFITVINFIVPPLMYSKMKAAQHSAERNKAVPIDEVATLIKSAGEEKIDDQMEKAVPFDGEENDSSRDVYLGEKQEALRISYAMIALSALLCSVLIYDKLLVS